MSDLTNWRGCALAARELLSRTPMHEPQRSEAAQLMAAIDALTRAEERPATSAATSFVSFGSNDHGGLGHGVMGAATWQPPKRVELPGDAHIVGWGAGDSACVFVGGGGELWVCGTNRGYLHADRNARGRERPSLVEALAGRRVTRAFVAAGSTHILAFVDGKLHGWGGFSKALGQEKSSPTLAPLPIENLAGSRHPGGVPESLVRDAALSAGHTLLVMHSGEVFASGSNARGQLGFGAPRNPYDTQTFERPSGVAGVHVVAGACGLQHTAVIAADGALYTCGQNEDGRLGHEAADDRFALARVDSGSIAGRRVAAVSCGSDFTLCISDDGALHGTGNNAAGQLGLGEVAAVRAFTAIPLPAGKRAAQVSCGDRHALVLCDDKTVLAFGDNTFAAVKPGEKGGFVKQPMALSFFAGQNVTAVVAGKSHSLVAIG